MQLYGRNIEFVLFFEGLQGSRHYDNKTEVGLHGKRTNGIHSSPTLPGAMKILIWRSFGFSSPFLAYLICDQQNRGTKTAAVSGYLSLKTCHCFAKSSYELLINTRLNISRYREGFSFPVDCRGRSEDPKTGTDGNYHSRAGKYITSVATSQLSPFFPGNGRR